MSSDLYFLEKGTVEIFHKPSSHTFAVLRVRRSQPGQHFGEISFFTASPRTASARCLQFCEVLSLSRSCILDLTKISPDANYTFQLIIDKLICKEYIYLDISCYVCKSHNHLAYKCEIAMLKVEKEPIAQKWLRKRNVKNRVIQPGSEDMANYRRRVRSVDAVKHYSVNNVRSEGWRRMNGWGFGLTKAVEKVRQEMDEAGDQSKVITGGKKDDMEHGPVPAGIQLTDIESTGRERIRAASHRPTLTGYSDEDFSPPATPRRYSLIAGVKAYPLRTQYGHENTELLAAKEVITEGSEEQED